MENANFFELGYFINNQLKRDIDIIKNEMTLVRNKNIEENIRNATITLNDLRSLSEEILDILRSISTLENSQNICNIATHQEPNSTSTSKEFMSAKKLFKRPNTRACVAVGKKPTTTVNKIIERPKEVHSCHKVKDKTKLGKFVMKEHSLVSLKFERELRKLE
ncbi:uncharacterized protein LOC143371839 [Andrena cerasifolii]|uniref:uncharacterized protein LOC143371839 n=1 Tax=Andrena cerasifolii TaxID=2819439 RepID=UPI004037F59B